jgi:plasmid stabilization system protein ParE
MSGYILTPTAQEDLAAIRAYYLEEAGQRAVRQMLVEFIEAFRFLSRTPGAGHKREDLAEDRPILFWSMRAYLIIYQKASCP